MAAGRRPVWAERAVDLAVNILRDGLVYAQRMVGVDNEAM